MSYLPASLPASPEFANQIQRERDRFDWWPTNRRLVCGLLLLALFAALALIGPWLIDADPAMQNLAESLLSPSIGDGHLFGADLLGRDMLARVAAGLRTSLLIGLASAVGAGVIGISLGMLAGYLGGGLDRVISFLADVQLSLPALVLGIAVAGMITPSIRTVTFVLIAAGWTGFQRVVRLQTRQITSAAYVEAARSIGASRVRIMARHVLPGLVGVIAVLFTQQFAAAMLFEAALTFVGAGLPSDVISLGGLIADGNRSILTAWWVSVIPGLALAALTFSILLIGDGIATMSEPRRQIGIQI